MKYVLITCLVVIILAFIYKIVLDCWRLSIEYKSKKQKQNEIDIKEDNNNDEISKG